MCLVHSRVLVVVIVDTTIGEAPFRMWFLNASSSSVVQWSVIIDTINDQ